VEKTETRAFWTNSSCECSAPPPMQLDQMVQKHSELSTWKSFKTVDVPLLKTVLHLMNWYLVGNFLFIAILLFST